MRVRMIIALVGMPGSGKSIAAVALDSAGIPVIRFGGFVIEEMKRRRLEINPNNEKLVREELRANGGMDVMAKLALPVIEQKLAANPIVGVDGLYSFSELKTLRARFDQQLVVVAIFTPRHLRYERLAIREDRPLMPAQAEARDYAEIENIEKGGPIAAADYVVINDGTPFELTSKMSSLLAELKAGS